MHNKNRWPNLILIVSVTSVTSLAGLGAGTALAAPRAAATVNGAVAWGDNTDGQLGDGTTASTDVPVPVKGLTGVTAVAAGGAHALARSCPTARSRRGSLVTLPNAGGEGSQLFGVTALSAGDVWAIGHTSESDAAILTLAEHFNGTAWSIAPTPDPGELGPLVDNGLLAAASPGNGTVWALGGQETLGECCQQTLGLQTTHG